MAPLQEARLWFLPMAGANLTDFYVASNWPAELVGNGEFRLFSPNIMRNF